MVLCSARRTAADTTLPALCTRCPLSAIVPTRCASGSGTGGARAWHKTSPNTLIYLSPTTLVWRQRWSAVVCGKKGHFPRSMAAHLRLLLKRAFPRVLTQAVPRLAKHQQFFPRSRSHLQLPANVCPAPLQCSSSAARSRIRSRRFPEIFVRSFAKPIFGRSCDESGINSFAANTRTCVGKHQ